MDAGATTLCELIRECYQSVPPKVTDSGGRFTFTLDGDGLLKASSIFKEAGLEFTIAGNQIEIDFRVPFGNSHFLYLTEQNFCQRFFEANSHFDSATIIITNAQGKSAAIIKEPSEKFSVDKAVFFNAHAQHQLLRLLREIEELRAYDSDAEEEMVLTNPASSNPLQVIKYAGAKNRVPQMTFDLGNEVKSLRENFSKGEYPSIFKEVILQHSKDRQATYDFFNIADTLPDLIKRTDLDYQIFRTKYSWSGISEKYKEERNRYLEALDKNLDAIGKQVVAIPLTFGATIFGTYQLKSNSSNPQAILYVLVAYGLYSLFSFYMLYMSCNGVAQLESDLDNEESQTKAKVSGEKNHILEEFRLGTKPVREKILRTKILIALLVIVLAALLCVFWNFYQNQAYVKVQ